MFYVMVKSTHEDHLFQPLQTDNKQFKIAVAFLTGYNGTFIVTNKNNKIYLAKSITHESGFIQNIILPGAYENKKLNNEIERNIINQSHFTEANYPFLIKPNFSTPGSIVEISSQDSLICFLPDDSGRNLLGFNATNLPEKYNLSPNCADIIWFDNTSLEIDIAQRMIFKGKRSGFIQNFTMDFDPG